MEVTGIHYFRPAGLDGIELLTCSNVGFDFPAHFHDAYCIWFNRSGGEQYSHRGHTDVLEPGDFSIVAPGEVHANRTLDHSARSLMTYYIQPARLQSLVRDVGGIARGSFMFKTGFYRDPECLELLAKLFGVLHRSPSLLAKESALLEVFFLLAKRHAIAGIQEPAIGNERTRVQKIIEVFQRELAGDLSIGELAGRFNCTPFHLIRFFKKEIGLTPYACLLRLRLERARELMTEGRPIVDIALETGFADQSHLNRHFKSLYGITPGQFKRQILGT